MREIKFRAWDGEGMFIQSEMGEFFVFEFKPDGIVLLVAEQYFETGSGVAEEHWRYNETKAEFMQFTGLKDKNGVEIFEGDIIQYGIFALNDIEKYGDKAWENLPEGVLKDDISTVLSTHRVDFFIPSLMALTQAIENNPDVRGLEVIGNIYENPELIK